MNREIAGTDAQKNQKQAQPTVWLLCLVLTIRVEMHCLTRSCCNRITARVMFRTRTRALRLTYCCKMRVGMASTQRSVFAV